MPGRQITKKVPTTGENVTFFWDKPGEPSDEDVRRIYEDQLLSAIKAEASKRAKPPSFWDQATQAVRAFPQIADATTELIRRSARQFFDIRPDIKELGQGIGQVTLPAFEKLQKVLPYSAQPITPEVRKEITGYPEERPEPIAEGLRRVIGGSLGAMRPLLPYALVTAPVPTIAGIAAASASHPVVEKTASAAGVPPQKAGLMADLASLGTGVKGARVGASLSIWGSALADMGSALAKRVLSRRVPPPLVEDVAKVETPKVETPKVETIGPQPTPTLTTTTSPTPTIAETATPTGVKVTKGARIRTTTPTVLKTIKTSATPTTPATETTTPQTPIDVTTTTPPVTTTETTTATPATAQDIANNALRAAGLLPSSVAEQSKIDVGLKKIRGRVFELRKGDEPIGQVKITAFGLQDVDTGRAYKTFEDAAADMLGDAAKGAEIRVAMPEVPQPGEGEVDLAEMSNEILSRLDVARATDILNRQSIREQRGQRVAQAMAAEGEGLAKHYAQARALKGKYAKMDLPFKAYGDPTQFLDETIKAINKLPDLQFFEQFRAGTALIKLVHGESLETNEIKLLGRIFDPKAVDELREITSDPKWKQILKAAPVEIPATMRTMMSAGDLSPALRQGITRVASKEWNDAFRVMHKAVGSEEIVKDVYRYIMTHPDYPLALRSGLEITDIDAPTGSRHREEAFAGKFPEKLPIIGSIVRGSERTYNVFLNKLRADTFYNEIADARRLREDIESLAPALARYINAATGRGRLPGKALRQGAGIINALFFSPRLIASRITLMDPRLYLSPKTPRRVRMLALKDLMRFGTFSFGILGLAKLAGADIGMDPTSADFGKAKVGNTRVDFFGGFQQYARLGAQLVKGEYTSSTTGETHKVGERIGGKVLTRGDLITRFFRQKLSPFASLVWDIVSGYDESGKKVDIPKEIIDRFTFMVLNDAIDIVKDDPTHLPLIIPGVYGAGVQTYKPEEKHFGLPSVRPPR